MAKSREHIVANGRAVFYASIYGDLKTAALKHGWALALHGSLNSDMDIMAMPWVEDAAPLDIMIDSLRECFTEPMEITIDTTSKPNNRIVITLSIWADFYLDINVIGPIKLSEQANPFYNK